MLTKINRFLTPNKRKAIYGVVAAAIAALIAFDVIQSERSLRLAGRDPHGARRALIADGVLQHEPRPRGRRWPMT